MDGHAIVVDAVDVDHLASFVAGKPFHVDTEGLLPHLELDRLPVGELGADPLLLVEGARVVRGLGQPSSPLLQEDHVHQHGNPVAFGGGEDSRLGHLKGRDGRTGNGQHPAGLSMSRVTMATCLPESGFGLFPAPANEGPKIR